MKIKSLFKKMMISRRRIDVDVELVERMIEMNTHPSCLSDQILSMALSIPWNDQIEKYVMGLLKRMTEESLVGFVIERYRHTGDLLCDILVSVSILEIIICCHGMDSLDVLLVPSCLLRIVEDKKGLNYIATHLPDFVRNIITRYVNICPITPSAITNIILAIILHGLDESLYWILRRDKGGWAMRCYENFCILQIKDPIHFIIRYPTICTDLLYYLTEPHKYIFQNNLLGLILDNEKYDLLGILGPTLTKIDPVHMKRVIWRILSQSRDAPLATYLGISARDIIRSYHVTLGRLFISDHQVYHFDEECKKMISLWLRNQS